MIDRLFSARALFGFSALFALYAMLTPGGLRPPPAWDRVEWIPLFPDGSLASIPDMVQNVALFLPLGAFGFFAFRRVGPPVLIGAGLSLLGEFLQTMSATRTPSTTDLCMNTGGALAGAVAAALVAAPLEQRWLPRWRSVVRRQPGSIVLAAFLVAVTWTALAPFLPSLDVGFLRSQARRVLDDPWGPRAWPMLTFDALLYAGLAVAWLRELPMPRRLWLLPPALAGTQLFFRSHTPALQDVVAGWVGIAAGSRFVRVTGPGPAREAGELVRRFPAVCLRYAIALVAVRALEPFSFGAFREPDPRAFVPFLMVFSRTTVPAVANVLAIVAAYVPLAWVLRRRGVPAMVAAASCLLLALALEVAQLLVAGRTFDVTEGLLAALAVPLTARLDPECRPAR